MARIRMSRAALLEIWLFIAQDSLPNAERYTSLLHEKFGTLSRQPRIGRARDELRIGMRSFPVGNYIIFYREIPGGILVLRVIHAARDVGRVFS